MYLKSMVKKKLMTFGQKILKVKSGIGTGSLSMCLNVSIKNWGLLDFLRLQLQFAITRDFFFFFFYLVIYILYIINMQDLRETNSKFLISTQ